MRNNSRFHLSRRKMSALGTIFLFFFGLVCIIRSNPNVVANFLFALRITDIPGHHVLDIYEPSMKVIAEVTVVPEKDGWVLLIRNRDLFSVKVVREPIDNPNF